MKKFIISIQSYTDVITNSSSELFVIPNSNELLNQITKIINNSEDLPENKCSGMGGHLKVKTLKQEFFGRSINDYREFYEKDFSPNYDGEDESDWDNYYSPKEKFLSIDVGFYSPEDWGKSYQDRGTEYTFLEFQEKFKMSTTDIFNNIYLGEWRHNFPEVNITGDTVIVEVDQGYLETIKLIETNLNGINTEDRYREINRSNIDMRDQVSACHCPRTGGLVPVSECEECYRFDGIDINGKVTCITPRLNVQKEYNVLKIDNKFYTRIELPESIDFEQSCNHCALAINISRLKTADGICAGGSNYHCEHNHVWREIEFNENFKQVKEYETGEENE